MRPTLQKAEALARECGALFEGAPEAGAWDEAGRACYLRWPGRKFAVLWLNDSPDGEPVWAGAPLEGEDARRLAESAPAMRPIS